MEINLLSREILRAMEVNKPQTFKFPTNAKLLSARVNISILMERDGMVFETKKINATTLKVTRVR